MLRSSELTTQASPAPSLRFKINSEDIFPDWTIVQIRDISQVNPKTGNIPESFYYIDLGSVKDGRLLQVRKEQRDTAPGRAQRGLKLYDILFQAVRPYQRNNLFFRLDDGIYIASTGYIVLRPAIDPRLLYQILHREAFVISVLKLCTGTSYPAISPSDLEKILIYIPQSQEEQEKIADFLSAVDKKIDMLEKKKELLEQYKKGVMQQIFSQKMRFKDEAGNDYPSWKHYSLGELGSLYRGHSYTSSDVQSEGHLVIRSSNIQRGHIDYLNELQFVSKEFPEKISLHKNDIVICMSNGSRPLVGKSGVYDGGYEGSITIGAFCSLLRTDQKIVKHLLQTQSYRRHLYILLSGTNINNLRSSDLESLEFFIPSNDQERGKISTFLNCIDMKIDLQDNSVKLLRKWKKGLLQQMFV